MWDPQAGKPDVGFRTFTTVGELLCYYWSPVFGSPTWQVWEFDFIVIVPLLPSRYSFFDFGRTVSFYGGSSILLSMAVEQLSKGRHWNPPKKPKQTKKNTTSKDKEAAIR